MGDEFLEIVDTMPDLPNMQFVPDVPDIAPGTDTNTIAEQVAESFWKTPGGIVIIVIVVIILCLLGWGGAECNRRRRLTELPTSEPVRSPRRLVSPPFEKLASDLDIEINPKFHRRLEQITVQETSHDMIDEILAIDAVECYAVLGSVIQLAGLIGGYYLYRSIRQRKQQQRVAL